MKIITYAIKKKVNSSYVEIYVEFKFISKTHKPCKFLFFFTLIFTFPYYVAGFYSSKDFYFFIKPCEFELSIFLKF